MIIHVAETVMGKTIEASADIPMQPDGTIYHEMLEKRLDELKHSLWAQMERAKGDGA